MYKTSCTTAQWAKKLRQWAVSAPGTPVDSGTMTELRSTIVNTLLQPTSERLKELDFFLAPLANHLSGELVQQNIDLWTMQAAEIPVLTTMVRLAREHVTWIDPEKSLAGIRYGESLLRIIMSGTAGESCSPGSSRALRLREWAKQLEQEYGRSFSDSTLSRVIKALERAGFIQLQGATRGRRCVFSAKACEWDTKQRTKPAPGSYLASPSPSVSFEADPRPAHSTKSITPDDYHRTRHVPEINSIDFFNEVMEA